MRTSRVLRALAALVPLVLAVGLPGPATAQVNPEIVIDESFRLPTVLAEPSPWVPLVTEDPVPAAVALLPASVAYGRWNREVGDGFAVLSADGTQYRRLPYRESGVPLVGALSPDGRWVAQGNRVADPQQRIGLVVTLLRLGDRTTRDVVLPESDGLLRYMLFDQDADRLYVVSSGSGSGPEYRFWTVDPRGGTAELVCRCPVRLGIGPFGEVRLHEGTPEVEDRLNLTTYGAGGEPAHDWLGRFPDAVNEDGSWAELYEYDQVRVVGQGRRVPRVLLPQEGAHALPLRLDDDRLLVAVTGGVDLSTVDGFRLVWVDLDSKRGRTALTAERFRPDVAPAVAAIAFGASSRLPTASTDVPWWSGDRRDQHVGAIVERLQEHALRDAGAAAAVLAAVGLLVIRRRRRRALR